MFTTSLNLSGKHQQKCHIDKENNAEKLKKKIEAGKIFFSEKGEDGLADEDEF